MPEKPDHLARLKELSTASEIAGMSSAERQDLIKDRAALNWLLDSHARLLAAAKAWQDYFDELDAAGCDANDPLTTERRKFHGKRIAATRAAIDFAEPKP